MKHAVVVCLDALRPDAITEAVMPNLYRLRQRAAHFARHRAIFPSDTRPNAAALVTGAACETHGINGNAFQADTREGPTLIDTGSAPAIAEADRSIAGGLYLSPTLDCILAQHGRSMAVVSSASSGTTRLLHHDAATDHVCLYAHDDQVSLPEGFGAEMTVRLGAPPAIDTPDLSAVAYGIDGFLSYIWPQRQPDVTLFWFNEPDVTYHAHGPFSSEAADALIALDRQVGRLIDWWDRDGRSAGVQLTILSDHGQIPTAESVDVIGLMREAGFDAGSAVDHQGAIRVVRGGFVQIYDETGDSIQGLLGWLQEQPWCGLIFAGASSIGAAPGALPLSAGLYENARAADLVFTFRARSEGGKPVVPYFDGGAAYQGMHGGLSSGETNAVCMMAGPALPTAGEICDVPSDTSDIVPTILSGLGLPVPPEMTGRVLIDPASNRPARRKWNSESLEASYGQYRQVLYRFRVGDHIYIDHGVAEWR